MRVYALRDDPWNSIKPLLPGSADYVGVIEAIQGDCNTL